MLHLLADVGGRLFKADRIVAERNEEQPGDILQRHRMQAELRLMHAELALGRGAERAVEIVGPGVIRAHERARVPLLLAADARAAVPAGVVEGADVPVLAARDDHRVMANRPRDPVAGSRDQAAMARIEPVAPPDAVDVRLEDLRRHVERPGQRAGAAIGAAERFDLIGVVIRMNVQAGHPTSAAEAS